MNTISIIVPVYNVEKYLAKCLESILVQTYQNIEVILINDGSTDDSPKIADEYAMKDHRIKVIHKSNGGLSDARNAGYQLVTGNYLTFVDSDDFISENFCEKLLSASQKYDADIVECNFVKFRENEVLQDLQHNDSIEEFDAEKAIELLMKGKLQQVVWNKLYKTKLVNHQLFKKGKIHEDEFWTYLVFGNAKKLVKISDVLYFYRQQDESIMAENYSIRRLYGMEAREERMHYVEKRFPKLSNLAVQTFWHAAFNNYQAIVRNPSLDADGKHRKKILEKVNKNVTSGYYSEWKIKDKFWLRFFSYAPQFCSRLRNFVGVGR